MHLSRCVDFPSLHSLFMSFCSLLLSCFHIIGKFLLVVWCLFVFQQGPDAPAFSFPSSLLSLSLAFLARVSVCLREKTASVHYIVSLVAVGGFGYRKAFA